MPRGRGFSSTPRGYRGSSNRGNSSWNGNSGRGGYSSSSRYNSFSSSMDSRSPYEQKSKYSSSGDRFSRSDDYHRSSYRSDYNSGHLSRDRRSPERKRMRLEAPSSRHDSYYGSSRHDPLPSYSERRLSSERHQSSPFSRREEFRRPPGPPKRGSYRGRISSRGSRGLRTSERPIRRRLVDSSYMVRKRIIPRVSDYSRRLKISRMRSAIVARRGIKRSPKAREYTDDDKDKDADSNDKEKPEKDEDKKADEKEKSDDDEEDEHRKPKSYIKLHCPHCGLKALTFRKYEMHLHGRSHLFAMRKVALKQKAILGQMRQAQRNTQNELEKSSSDLGNRTNFCPLCKLNYKQKRAVHQLSESHKNMKKFLMPFCKVCNISFKSPMIYENHCCSIDHIKRKQRMENSDGSAEEDNLENFTTIDSVGDVDGEGSETEEKKEEDDKEPPVNVGIEKIRKIEAYYCDLCKMYLQRGDDAEIQKILARHCKQRVHMHRYVRMKEAQDLEKRAEKLQRKELAEKETVIKTESMEETERGDKEKTSKTDDDETKDDKLWADVDKDLGDILAEAESGIKSSDEDDDSHINGERYDRFKLSEKNGEEKLMGADEEGILDNKLIIEDTVEKK